jgi:GNAT superfamily N-acetyltransferase
MGMIGFEIARVHVPATIDAADAGGFLGMVDVRNAVSEEAIGSPDLEVLPAELLPHWLDTEFDRIVGFLATIDGHVRGRAYCSFDPDPGTQDVDAIVEVLPAYRRLGIGSALLDRLEEAMRAESRSILQGDFLATSSDGATTIASPTGFGAVPRGNPGVEFALAKGFTLEQVERFSALALPAPGISEKLAGLPAHPDYRAETWVGPTAEHRLADIALMHSRMKTDAPAGGLDLSEERWDEERVRLLDAGRVRAGQTLLVAAVEYVPTGRLVGFNELLVPEDVTRPVMQNDTLVLREHRGHRLGMLVKLANLAQLQRTRPGHPRVLTFNAEENRPMLDVNEAIGFEPVAYGGAWKLVLPPVAR